MILSRHLRAVRIQVWADLRPQLRGGGLASLVFVPTVYLVTSRVFTGSVDGPLSFGAYMIVGILGANGAFAAMQIAAEMYSERISGTLLRVRITPHGPLIWAVSKTVTATIITLIYQILLIIGVASLIGDVPLTAGTSIIAIGLCLLIIAACAPLGFVIGALARGGYTMFFGYFGFLAVFCTSGIFFPLTQLPMWLQVVHQSLPMYWSGHLARYMLLDGDTAFEVSGSFLPIVALAILLTWTIVGFALAIFIIRRAFRSETISSMSSLQEKVLSHMGIS